MSVLAPLASWLHVPELQAAAAEVADHPVLDCQAPEGEVLLEGATAQCFGLKTPLELPLSASLKPLRA